MAPKSVHHSSFGRRRGRSHAAALLARQFSFSFIAFTPQRCTWPSLLFLFLLRVHDFSSFHRRRRRRRRRRRGLQEQDNGSDSALPSPSSGKKKEEREHVVSCGLAFTFLFFSVLCVCTLIIFSSVHKLLVGWLAAGVTDRHRHQGQRRCFSVFTTCLPVCWFFPSFSRPFSLLCSFRCLWFFTAVHSSHFQFCSVLFHSVFAILLGSSVQFSSPVAACLPACFPARQSV